VIGDFAIIPFLFVHFLSGFWLLITDH